MHIIFETERLILREFSIQDAEPFYRMNLDQDVIKYTGDKPFESVEKAQEFIQNYNEYIKSGFGRWAIISKETASFIGFCGLKQHQDYVDIGFRLFRKEWNKGYATEAGKATVDYAFNTLGLHFLVGRVVKENIGSIAVLKKIGMQFDRNGNCNELGNVLYFKIQKLQLDVIEQK